MRWREQLEARNLEPRALRGMIDWPHKLFSGTTGEQIDEDALSSWRCTASESRAMMGAGLSVNTGTQHPGATESAGERAVNLGVLLEACLASTNVKTIELMRYTASVGTDIGFVIPPPLAGERRGA
jgi:hypothetical protein